MFTIKTLEWKTDDEGYIYAEPQGLQWSYYITPLENGIYELNLLDANGGWNHALQKTYVTINAAKLAATKHYTDTIFKLIEPISA